MLIINVEMFQENNYNTSVENALTVTVHTFALLLLSVDNNNNSNNLVVLLVGWPGSNIDVFSATPTPC